MEINSNNVSLVFGALCPPLTILDWVGGPSIYFFTNDNMISGIDHVPSNDSWIISSISSSGNLSIGDSPSLASLI
jgi:hypothetical protein